MVSWGEFRGVLLAASGGLLLVFAVIALQLNLPGAQLLQSLRFHFIAAGFVLAVLLALTGARWRGLAMGLLVIGMAAHSATYLVEFQQRRVDHAAAPLAQFRFLSFNVLNGNRRIEELVETVIADPPDIALFMESRAIQPYLDRLAEVFPYRLGCESTGPCDTSLHSRFPLADGELAVLSPLWANRYVSARVTVDGQKVNIVGLHLAKPYYDDLAQWELWSISQRMSRMEGAVVVAGDFNAASWSDPVAEFGRVQNLAPGPTQPATWPVRLSALGVPIDNVFTRGSAQIMSLEAGDNLGSNHRPLWAEIGLYGVD